MKYLLDTNAYSALMRGRPAVVELVRNAEAVLMSTVVVGELCYGFFHGSRTDANIQGLDRFLASAYVEVLDVTRVTADRFGRVAAALRRKGTPIPTNDIWIAAHALESGANLLSFDHHFAHVDGLVWTHPE